MNVARLAAALLGCAAATAQAAPEVMAFELPRLDASRFVTLNEFGGRPVLVNFWGSDCPPCVHEMPLLDVQRQQHPALQFIGVAVDERSQALAFLQRHPVGMLQLLAPLQPAALLRRFGNRLGVLPYTVVLDAGLRICKAQAGEIDATWIDAAARACASEATP